MNSNVLIGLKIMGLGMGGIFLAIGIIMIVVIALNAMNKGDNKSKE